MRPIAGLVGAAALLAGCVPTDMDGQLLVAMVAAGADAIERPPAVSDAEFDLGRALFFDKELSGNRDTACASCHHPRALTGDGLSLSFGTGSTGVADDRVLGEGQELIPRNSPELFNRGDSAWTTMFWDMRVATDPYAPGISAPSLVPAGLNGALAAQALFPPTSRGEMRGFSGDVGVDGSPNELAELEDASDIWAALSQRIHAIPEYVEMLAQAYPEQGPAASGMVQIGNAIAAFEAEAFALPGAPYDRYLRGEFDALTEAEKRGGLLFFGDAACSECHSGPLLTDQLAHNLAVPQLGPGKEEGSPLDRGRVIETGDDKDTFCFRTPPLRNVEATGPWMHNGAYTTLEGAVRHHLNVRVSLRDWDAGQLDPAFADSVSDEAEVRGALLARLDPSMETPIELSDAEFSDLIEFLGALTDPEVWELGRFVPDSVPSGMPVDR